MSKPSLYEFGMESAWGTPIPVRSVEEDERRTQIELGVMLMNALPDDGPVQ